METGVEPFVAANAWLAADRAVATTRSQDIACRDKKMPWLSNYRWITYQNFGLTNFAVRASVRCFIRLRFPQTSNTRREFWSDTAAICFTSPLFLVLNMDFSARRRTT